MRTAGLVVLSILWVLALVLYTAPLWLPSFGSVDVAVDPPHQAALVKRALLGLSFVPLLVLAFLTWWFLHRAHA